MSDIISSSREGVCSGIRPTGNLHLGNYFGALRNFIKMQENQPLPKEQLNQHGNTNQVKKKDKRYYGKFLVFVV